MASQTDISQHRRAGIVLCGGRSSRMGRAKADLPFGDETMLQRVVHTLSKVVDRVVVVASAEQVVPELSRHVVVVRDVRPHEGPLAGLAMGLSRLAAVDGDSAPAPQPVEAAYLTSCDVPWLSPAFIREMFSHLGDNDIAVPYDKQFYHPLAAVYRVCHHQMVNDLLAAGVRRPRELFEHLRTTRVDTTALDKIDSGLRSLVNVNTPEEYAAALQQAGYPVPDWIADRMVDAAFRKNENKEA